MAKFQLGLIKQIIAKYLHNVVQRQSRLIDNPKRLTERHFPYSMSQKIKTENEDVSFVEKMIKDPNHDMGVKIAMLAYV